MRASIGFLDFQSQCNLDPSGTELLYLVGMDVAEWVRAARKRGRMNQTQLGAAAGVGKQNVSAWENNRHEPSFSQMLRIAEATGHPMPNQSARCPLSPDLVSALAHLDGDELRKAENALRALVNMDPLPRAGNQAAA